MDSSKVMGDFPDVKNFNWLFLKLNQFIYNFSGRFPPFNAMHQYSGRFWHNVQDPSVSESNRLHAPVFLYDLIYVL